MIESRERAYRSQFHIGYLPRKYTSRPVILLQWWTLIFTTIRHYCLHWSFSKGDGHADDSGLVRLDDEGA